MTTTTMGSTQIQQAEQLQPPTPEQNALLALSTNTKALENLLVGLASLSFNALTQCHHLLPAEKIATILIANFNSRHFPSLFITNLSRIVGKFQEKYQGLTESSSVYLSEISTGSLANILAPELTCYSDCGIMQIVSTPNSDKEIFITTKGLAVINEIGRISSLTEQEFNSLEPRLHIKRAQFQNISTELKKFFLANKG